MRSSYTKGVLTAFLVILVLRVGSLCSAQTLINGVGATFPYPIYSKWFNEYHKLHPDTQINYQSLGSGAGIKQITEGTVDFGASDALMTEDQIKEFEARHGCPVHAFPTVLGAVVVTYNIPGVTQTLNLTGEIVANIYLGKITKWNDPAITSINPNVHLSAADIVVVHRSDGSGTTFCFTDYLSKVSPEWKSKVGNGASVNWPVGLGGKGNEGVTGQVKQISGGIGYIELIYALQNQLPYADVKNAAGQYIRPSLQTVTAAAAGAAANMPEDFRVSITNASGRNANPISTFTWLLIPGKIQDAAKRKTITDFLNWMLGQGQDFTEGLAYARLPREVIAKEVKAIANVK